MVSHAARYGTDIGTGALTGAASGASIGTAVLPGWGTAIGGAVGGLVGGGVGAVQAAVGNADEDRAKKRLEAQQARERQSALVAVLEQQARSEGADTSDLDAWMDARGIQRNQYAQTQAFNLQNRLDPNAFVGMAKSGAQLAGSLYKAGQPQPMSQPMQIQGMPSYPTLQNPGADYQIDEDRLRQLQGLA
jgi:hypothetical protein